jgi:hypothetical protein
MHQQPHAPSWCWNLVLREVRIVFDIFGDPIFVPISFAHLTNNGILTPTWRSTVAGPAHRIVVAAFRFGTSRTSTDDKFDDQQDVRKRFGSQRSNHS